MMKILGPEFAYEEVMNHFFQVCQEHKLTFNEAEETLDHLKTDLKNQKIMCK